MLLSRTFLFRLPIIIRFGTLLLKLQESLRPEHETSQCLTYFWTLTGFFFTFLCLGFAKIEEEANVEKEKLLCCAGRHRVLVASSNPIPV